MRRDVNDVAELPNDLPTYEWSHARILLALGAPIAADRVFLSLMNGSGECGDGRFYCGREEVGVADNERRLAATKSLQGDPARAGR